MSTAAVEAAPAPFDGLDAAELAARGIRQVFPKPLDGHTLLQVLADAWLTPG